MVPVTADYNDCVVLGDTVLLHFKTFCGVLSA